MKLKIKAILAFAATALMLLSCHQKRDYDYSRWYADPNGASSGRPINVMSFNWRTETSGDPGELSWANRRKAVAAMLKAKSPILMGCQECEPNQKEQILSGLYPLLSPCDSGFVPGLGCALSGQKVYKCGFSHIGYPGHERAYRSAQ